MALLAAPAFHWLRSARQPVPALLRAVRVVLGILAVCGVVLVTPGSFGLLLTMLSAVEAAMSATVELGNLSFSIGAAAPGLPPPEPAAP